VAKKVEINRREFLVSTSAAAIGMTALNRKEASGGNHAPAFRSPAGSLIPYSRHELFPEERKQRSFSGAQLSEIAFPLGGIGTGTVSLGGRGQLRDWEIFNRPGKGKILPSSFVALWLRPEGDSRGIVKVVEGPLMPPYRGSSGSSRESAEGLPRLQGAHFTGAYPIAKIDFEDDSLPLKISLDAFNPFIPLDVEASSLPVAVFQYHLQSRSEKPVDLALAFSLMNAVGYNGKAQLQEATHPGLGKNLNKVRQEHLSSGQIVNGLEMTSSKYSPPEVGYGSMALLTTSPQFTAQTSWGELGEWWDPFQKWLDEFTRDGTVHDASPTMPSGDGRSNYATLAPKARLNPGESTTITFLLAWYFPVRENDWNEEKEVRGQKLRNDYGTRFESAWEIGQHALTHMGELEGKTRAFQKAFFSSKLPAYVLEAVSSQAAIIRTNTCMLLEGKQFFAFEGCDDNQGCCPMNCTHVWNYEQALAFLYPELERSMRHTDFTYNMRADGSMAFRSMVPLGRLQWHFGPAADGQMGSILKLYREWQLSGDDDFLKQLWPQAKRALEFAWTAWDADKDGVMEGQQHNTYDIYFYGPNPMMTTLYLGALQAGERMATSVGDLAAAEDYRQVREKGVRNLESLWNGEFYIQKIPEVGNIRPLANYAPANWHAEAVQDGQIKYQFGEGCLSDQLLGEWFATVVGLDVGWSSEHARTALRSIYRYNFKHNFYQHPNTQRIYALNDEKGLLLCSWPKGGRPSLPFVYSDEVWTGIEYQVAAHLIYEGLLDEGLSIVRGICDRYDGARRNPWNQVECGSHYARALASWSVLLALAGYRYSAKEQSLSFMPAVNTRDFQCFFAAGSGWGTFSQQLRNSSLEVRLEVLHGQVRLQRLRLRNETGDPSASLSARTRLGANLLHEVQVRPDQQNLQIDFGSDVVVVAGSALNLTLSPVLR
jgi:non-lysosomal glucosylceramidase